MKRVTLLLMVTAILFMLVACVGEMPKTEKYCWSCGGGITEQAIFCEHCGVSQEGSGDQNIEATSNNGTTGVPQTPTGESTTKPTNGSATPPTQTPTETPTTHPTTCNHNWKDATCTAPKTCSVCKATEGKATDHTWIDATCTAPKKCSSCGCTDGSTKEHSYESGKCKDCGKTDPVYDAITEFNSRIKIYGTYIYVDSADGVSVYLTWENKSDKEIKYMYFRVELYNRVNDRLDCDITGKTSMNLKQTGPIPKGKGMYHCSGVSFAYPTFGATPNDRHFISSTVTYDEYYSDEDNGWAGRYWDNVWYNSSAYYIKITGIQIDYMDGTRYTMLDEDFFDNLGIINLTIKDSVWEY